MSDPATQRVHALFRGASEVAKAVRAFALTLDLAAGGLASWVILVNDARLSVWQPLIGLMLLALSEAGRQYAERTARYAERCRTVSVRAYAFESQVDPGVLGALFEAAPFGAEWAAKRLPSSSLEEYYAPSEPPGDQRLRGIYSHSAFYTGRILRRSGVLQLALSAALIGGTIVAMYSLATNPAPPSEKLPLLEALTTFVLAVLGLRLLSSGLAATASGAEASRVATALLSEPPPQRERLLQLADEYDFSRAGGASVPTWLYRSMRGGIARDWGYVQGPRV